MLINVPKQFFPTCGDDDLQVRDHPDDHLQLRRHEHGWASSLRGQDSLGKTIGNLQPSISCSWIKRASKKETCTIPKKESKLSKLYLVPQESDSQAKSSSSVVPGWPPHPCIVDNNEIPAFLDPQWAPSTQKSTTHIAVIPHVPHNT